jgi:hypothetical protein
MKQIIFFALVLFVSVLSCTKQNTTSSSKPFPSILYYRIEEQDLNGNVMYSKVVVVGSTKPTVVTDDDDGHNRNCQTANPHSDWYRDNCVLTPVVFFSVSAQVQGRIVVLDWQTGVESNVKTFIVQRSQDGTTYEDAGYIAPKGADGTGASYEFLDKTYN